MANRTYICAECRTSRRAEAAGGLETPLRCPTCSGPLWELGQQRCIPRKTDDRAWLEFKAMVIAAEPVRKDQVERRGTQLLRVIDWQIGVVSTQEATPDHEATLQQLQREKAGIQLRYFPTRASEGAWD